MNAYLLDYFNNLKSECLFMPTQMFPSENLNIIRSLYITKLLEAIARHPESYIEPALRSESGELAVDGALKLPCRVDLIPAEGTEAGQSITVDSPGKANFPEIIFHLTDTIVVIDPFIWDYASIFIEHSSNSTIETPLQKWFMKWFDPDDLNPLNDESLYGVVHFMSDPEPVESGSKIIIDFGSAPAEALCDLLRTLSEVKVARVQVSQ